MREWIYILLRNGLGHAGDTRLREGIVNLTRVAVHTRSARDVDDVSRLAVLHAEVWGRSADNLERRCCVQVDDGVPLLVRHLVDHAVPRVAGIVDDDVDLAVAKVGGFLDERFNVGVVEDIAGDRDGRAAGLLDFVDYRLRFLCAASVRELGVVGTLAGEEKAYWHQHPQRQPSRPLSQTVAQPRRQFLVLSP
jgi:hypothetical protein